MNQKTLFNMFELRQYQKENSRQGLEVLKKHKILILAMEVRTGKTHTALDIAKNYNNVLFVTKLKAISSIENDYKAADHKFNLQIINFESLHKVQGSFDLVIVDESHSISAFPKPSKRTKELKKLVSNDLILMTGTLIPESNSQIFHQLWISKYSPYNRYKNFYEWFNSYGVPEIVYTSYGQAKSYKNSKWDKIEKDISKILITFTQKEASFNSVINETILEVDIKTLPLIKRLQKDQVIEGKDEVILGDTPVKLMQKIHQLSSGTIKFESGNKMILDDSKSKFISNHFKGKKKAIFYKFTEELKAIKLHHNITQDIEEFNNTDKDIALQIISGREGINLSKADCLIMYNIDFSAVSYWQSRDRMTTKERLVNEVYWIFSKGGIERNIYKAVSEKKDYTLKLWKQDYKIK